MKVEIVPLVIALIGTAGLGGFFREIIAGVVKMLGGMSARESKRKVDIVEQRDAAIARESKAWRLVDSEAEKRRIIQEWAAHLQRQLIVAGIEPAPEPVLEKSITKAQLAELRGTESTP
jgi:hypothetical protein